jgi:hypothetical protein
MGRRHVCPVFFVGLFRGFPESWYLEDELKAVVGHEPVADRVAGDVHGRTPGESPGLEGSDVVKDRQ